VAQDDKRAQNNVNKSTAGENKNSTSSPVGPDTKSDKKLPEEKESNSTSTTTKNGEKTKVAEATQAPEESPTKTASPKTTTTVIAFEDDPAETDPNASPGEDTSHTETPPHATSTGKTEKQDSEPKNLKVISGVAAGCVIVAALGIFAFRKWGIKVRIFLLWQSTHGFTLKNITLSLLEVSRTKLRGTT
jgi:DNA mismatch repair ATPase MutL